MTEGPGTGCALVMWDQLAILCTPLEYCNATVFPARHQLPFMFVVPMPMKGHTNIREFSVLEYEEIMLDAELLEPDYQGRLEVFDDIDMCLEKK